MPPKSKEMYYIIVHSGGPLSKAIEILGENIAVFRRKLGLTQSDLAKKVGITRGTVTRLEKGLQSIRPETLAKMASVFGVSEANLYQAPHAEPTTVHQKLQDAISLLTETEARVVLGIVQDRILTLRQKDQKTGSK